MSLRKSKNQISRRDFVQTAGFGTMAFAGASAMSGVEAHAQQSGTVAAPTRWDLQADVVIIGSGAVGMTAAIRLRDAGASVIVVDANYDIGGKAICSGAQISLGGGTAMQKKYKFEDSPDLFFRDLTDWSVVEHNKMPEYRYNDRGVQRALADNSAQTYDFLVANGVEFRDASPADIAHGHAVGISAPRGHTPLGPPNGEGGFSAYSPRAGGGANLMRPLEVSARKKGVRFLLNYHMDVIFRQTPTSGPVIGIKASHTPKIMPGSTVPLKSLRSDGNIDLTTPTVTVKANKAVIIGTGGSAGNVHFRKIFDARLTEEFQVAAGIYASQDASGELAAMALGASLWGTSNQSNEKVRTFGGKPSRLGCQDNYTLGWGPESPVFPLARATGVQVRNWQNLILVNQVGKRYYNEAAPGGYPYGSFYKFLDPYHPGDWRNPGRVPYELTAYNDAALAMNEGSKAPEFGAGPQWAIFDAEAVKREKWSLEAPATDPLYFFSSDTLESLAAKLTQNPHQKAEMPGATLKATVARYNLMVELGVDPDFEKPTPAFKIAVPPFYAAWATIMTHDSYAGLRINMKCQVLDFKGQVIPGLYCGGESAGGCGQHGLGRCLTQGYIAGGAAAAEPNH